VPILAHRGLRRAPTLLLSLVVVASPAALRAQGDVDPLVMSTPVTREALSSKIAELEQARGGDEARRAERLASLRARLRDGDFRPGDRIAIVVQGERVLSDTFVVQSGRVVELPNVGTVSVAGVLRSEIEPHLKRELGRYLQRPDVRAVPLLQIAVVGRVGRPGFHVVPATAMLPDVLTAAGGYTTDADPAHTHIRRDARELWEPARVRYAIANGLSVDAMDLRPNDEIVVEQQRRRDFASWVQIAVGLVGAIGAVVLISRR
jgi:protein involved in polysaccharide export with SLBB domain